MVDDDYGCGYFEKRPAIFVAKPVHGFVSTFEMTVIEYGITCSGEVAQIQAADESAILGNHAISTCTDGQLGLYDSFGSLLS